MFPWALPSPLPLQTLLVTSAPRRQPCPPPTLFAAALPTSASRGEHRGRLAIASSGSSCPSTGSFSFCRQVAAQARSEKQLCAEARRPPLFTVRRGGGGRGAAAGLAAARAADGRCGSVSPVAGAALRGLLRVRGHRPGPFARVRKEIPSQRGWAPVRGDGPKQGGQPPACWRGCTGTPAPHTLPLSFRRGLGISDFNRAIAWSQNSHFSE